VNQATIAAAKDAGKEFAMLARSRHLAAAVVLIVSCAFAEETKIQRSALPQAVNKTVEELSKGATIKGFSMETENGKVEYEVEMTVNGHGKDVSIAKDGTVLEVEEEVAMNALPADVKSALIARAGTATIVMVESVSKAGKIVSYEADTLQGKKKAEIAVGPHGEKVGRGN
jgi:uncharacterized membrane protein YkoI